MKFFEPNARFFEFLNSFDDDAIFVDIGCGEGHVTKAITEAGHKAFGLEFRLEVVAPEMLMNGVYIMDATKFQYLPPMVPLLCRPCHGPFPRTAIDQALKGADHVYYVGLSKNLQNDLGVHFEPIWMNVGADEENIWRINKNVL